MKIKFGFVTLIAAVLLSTHVNAGNYRQQNHYKVTVINITKGISFTLLLATTHNRDICLFEVGKSASEEVFRVTEDGNIAPLTELLSESHNVHSTASTVAYLLRDNQLKLMIRKNLKELV